MLSFRWLVCWCEEKFLERESERTNNLNRYIALSRRYKELLFILILSVFLQGFVELRRSLEIQNGALDLEGGGDGTNEMMVHDHAVLTLTFPAVIAEVLQTNAMVNNAIIAILARKSRLAAWFSSKDVEHVESTKLMMRSLPSRVAKSADDIVKSF